MPKYIGLALVIVGVAGLVASIFSGLSSRNWALISCLALVVLGILVWVWGIKRESPY